MDCEEERGEIGTHSYYGSDAGNHLELTVLKHRCRVGWRGTRVGWRSGRLWEGGLRPTSEQSKESFTLHF